MEPQRANIITQKIQYYIEGGYTVGKLIVISADTGEVIPIKEKEVQVTYILDVD